MSAKFGRSTFLSEHTACSLSTRLRKKHIDECHDLPFLVGRVNMYILTSTCYDQQLVFVRLALAAYETEEVASKIFLRRLNGFPAPRLEHHDVPPPWSWGFWLVEVAGSKFLLRKFTSFSIKLLQYWCWQYSNFKFASLDPFYLVSVFNKELKGSIGWNRVSK